MPKLLREVRLQALSVARNRCTFDEAVDFVACRARALGANRLGDNGLAEIDDWIATRFLDVIDDIDTRPEAAAEIVDEALHWLLGYE